MSAPTYDRETIQAMIEEIQATREAIRKFGRPSSDLDRGFEQGMVTALDVLRRGLRAASVTTNKGADK